MARLAVDGLISGLDTTSIIAQLMQLERAPIGQLQARIATEQSRLTLLQDLNTRLVALGSSVENLGSGSTFLARLATSNNSEVVSATAGSSATLGTFSVEVTQLALTHQISSDASFSDPDAELGAEGDIIINQQAIYLSSTDSLNDVVQKINDANAGVTAAAVQVSEGDYRLTLSSSETGAEGMTLADSNDSDILSSILHLTTSSTSIAHSLNGGLGAASDYFTNDNITLQSLLGLTDPQSGTITIDDGTPVQVSIDLDNDSLQTIADKINNAGGSVSASVVSAEVDGETVYRLEISGAGTVSFTDSNNVLETMGILRASPAQEDQAGQDAQFMVNGLALTRSSNTVSDAIEGVTLQLLDEDPGQPVTISIEQDIASVSFAIEDFVAQYNAIQSFFQNHASYDIETETAGLMLGDSTVWMVGRRLAGILNQEVPAILSARLSTLNDGTGVAKGSIQVTDRDGHSVVIDLSSAQTLEEVIEAINSESDIEITASLNNTRDGLMLTDTSGGSGTITVAEVDSSTAADLGILGSSSQANLVGFTIGDDDIYSASQIGLSSDLEGNLEIDSDTLDDLLDNNIDMIRSLFSTTDNGIGQIADEVIDLLTDPAEGTLKYRTDAIQDEIDDMNNSIERIEQRLVIRQERLFSQFTQLEIALAQFQRLGDYMDQQMGNWGNIWQGDWGA